MKILVCLHAINQNRKLFSENEYLQERISQLEKKNRKLRLKILVDASESDIDLSSSSNSSDEENLDTNRTVAPRSRQDDS